MGALQDVSGSELPASALGTARQLRKLVNPLASYGSACVVRFGTEYGLINTYQLPDGSNDTVMISSPTDTVSTPWRGDQVITYDSSRGLRLDTELLKPFIVDGSCPALFTKRVTLTEEHGQSNLMDDAYAFITTYERSVVPELYADVSEPLTL